MKLRLLVLVLIPFLASAATPAERAIVRAEKAVEQNAERPEAYNELATALARRARETADPEYYVRAHRALDKSFALAPDNFEGRKARAWVLLGQHEFAKALEIAKALNRQVPDDVLVYGLLTDAHMELGNYKDALESVQWMLDMRPGNVPGLTRAAYVREAIGYLDGAIEFMTQAFQRTNHSEVEDRAWILTQMAHLHLATGKVREAERLAGQALELFPGYHYALAQMAKVRAADGKHAEAVELLSKRYDAAPHPENLFDLAAALDRAGRKQEAQAAFREFEEKARRESAGWDNANRELISYYVDFARKPAAALEIARVEIARKQDVHTLDAYAWALAANGRHAEAWTQIEKALKVGVKDARIYYHAGAIASKLGDRAAAARKLLAALGAPRLVSQRGATLEPSRGQKER